MDIYEPAEDSYLLAKHVKKHVKKGDKVLDVGCGSGIQSEEALKITKNVIGVDINPKALKQCQNSPYTNKGFFLKSNLFSVFKDYFCFRLKRIDKTRDKTNQFDVIIFNPPYLPDQNDPKEIKDYTTGGKKGFEIVDQFMKSVNTYLKDEGKILLLFSSLTNKKRVDDIIEKYLFEKKELAKESHMMEQLYCYKITKSDLLKKFNKKHIANVSYLEKGTRGIVFKGTYKNKVVAIKTKKDTSHAVSTLDFESRWTKRMNKLGIGPTLISSTDEMVILEYIEGDRIIDYCKKATKAQIKKVFLNVLNQMILLDKAGFEKKEMTRPYKHIIVRNHKPVLIDFERTRKTLQPSNVTQFLQYLISGHIGEFIKYDKKKVMALSKKYRKDLDPKPIIAFFKSK